MDNGVLRKSGRGHTAEDTENAAKMIKEHGFSLGLQMMIGLPGDTLQKSINTARKIIELKADNTRIYPSLVIRGTKLEELFNAGEYKPLSLEEAVTWSAALLKIFEEANINVIRIGLHPSEGLLSGDELVAGPFHPSFRELVLTEIWGEQLASFISGKGNLLEITVPPNQINSAIGYNSKNKLLLKQKFKKVKFLTDGRLQNRQMKISTS